MPFIDPKKRTENLYLTDTGGGGNEKALTWEEIQLRRKKLREAAARVREAHQGAETQNTPPNADKQPTSAITQSFLDKAPSTPWPPEPENNIQNQFPGATVQPEPPAQNYFEDLPAQVKPYGTVSAVARPVSVEDDEFTYEDYQQAMRNILIPMSADRSFSNFIAGTEAMDILDEYGYHNFSQAAKARKIKHQNEYADLEQRYKDATDKESEIISNMNGGLVYGAPVDPQTYEGITDRMDERANENERSYEEWERLVEYRNALEAQIKDVEDLNINYQDELYELNHDSNTFGIKITHTETELKMLIRQSVTTLARLNSELAEMDRLIEEGKEDAEDLKMFNDIYSNSTQAAHGIENPVSYEENWETAKGLPEIRDYKEALREQMDAKTTEIDEAGAQQLMLEGQEKHNATCDNLDEIYAIIDESGDDEILGVIAELEDAYVNESDPDKQELMKSQIAFLTTYSITGSQQTSIEWLEEMNAGHEALEGELAMAEGDIDYYEWAVNYAKNGYRPTREEYARFMTGEELWLEQLEADEQNGVIQEAEKSLADAKEEVSTIESLIKYYDREVAPVIEKVRLNADNGYTGIPLRDDFAEKSKMVPGHDIIFMDTYAASVSGVGSYGNNSIVYGTIYVPLDQSRAGRYMTDEEKAIAYYLLNTEGSEAAHKYIRDFLKDEINHREHDALIEYGQKLIDESSGPEAMMYGCLASLASGVNGIVAGSQTIMENLFEGDIYSEFYHRASENSESGNLQALLNQIGSSSIDKVYAEYGPDIALLYEIGLEVISDVPSSMTGNFATVINGVRKFQEVYQRAIDDDLGKEQAIATAGGAAMISVAVDSIPLDELLRLPGEVSLTEALAIVAAQSLGESSLSGVEYYVNYLYDYLANGDMSQYERSLEKLTDAGVPKDEAEKMVKAEIAYAVSKKMTSGAFEGGIDAEIDLSSLNIPE